MFAKLKVLLGRFRADRSGVTAIEYGVIAAGIIVIIIATIYAIGPQLENAFESVNSSLASGGTP